MHAVLSYDGAYQVRSGKSGGGFSPYCFETAISIDMGKVVAYEVGCNSCRECTLYGNKLREKEITEGHASSRTIIEVKLTSISLIIANDVKSMYHKSQESLMYV